MKKRREPIYKFDINNTIGLETQCRIWLVERIYTWTQPISADSVMLGDQLRHE